ncbi:MAG TPA: hypothetical protein VGZ02_06020 [Candidatus Baltobacteraceae bacterium]|nr:hypothetical protein [Candidatus Baltobacteraceae bacterium]
MFKKALLRCVTLAAAVSIASCGQSSVPRSSSPASVLRPSSGTVTTYAIMKSSTVSSTVTFYGWPDNSPPGCQIAHPVIHQCAGGTGTYSNPITFATETSNGSKLPYGVRIYVPFMKRYFIREDDCAGCTGMWVDLWVGGNNSDNPNDVIACENYLTPGSPQKIIINPPSNEPVKAGAIWNESNGECNGTYNYARTARHNTRLGPPLGRR